jgi:hypothetical protein
VAEHYYTFIVKIRNGSNKPPRGYVDDNTSLERAYFDNFPALEDFIMAHLGHSSEDADKKDFEARFESG